MGVDDIYEQVRAAMPVVAHDAGELLPIAPGIRVLALRTPTLPPAAHTNAYIVGPVDGPVVVVDPGSPYPDQQAALAKVLGNVMAVLLTHHHGDHVGGATAVASGRTPASSGAEGHRGGINVDIAAHAETASRVGFPVQRLLADGEVLDIGGVKLECIFTPGHAAGHLCYRVGDAIIAGDMVAGLGTILIDPSEGDMALYLASLEKLIPYGGALLPAHGPMIADGPKKLREYLAHRRMRESAVLAALSHEPQSVAALVGKAYADTPKVLWPLAERSLLAHLAKLVAEGRARSAAGAFTL